MHYRRFGKTELMLPVITCGGMRFQQSWKDADPISEESQQNLEACVHRALELGINHIETARGYGTSEAQLGRILPKLNRDDIIVQTKVGPETEVDKFVANFEDSLARLHLDHIDIFSFHGINTDELFAQTMHCMEPVLKWKEKGVIRHIGFTSHGPTDIIVKAIETNAFESVNLHWFYIFRERWPAIQAAAERDMGVYIISPNDKGGMLYNPPPKLERLTAPYHPMAFNDLFCLARPEIHSLSCGVAKPEDFDIHVQAVERAGEAEALTAPIAARLDEEMERVLGAEWIATWHEGLPKWQDTPEGINIPAILWLGNLVKAFDMDAYGKMRYNLLGQGEHWFPGNKADKLGGVDLAECLQRSPHAEAIPAMLKEIHERLAGEDVNRLQQE